MTSEEVWMFATDKLVGQLYQNVLRIDRINDLHSRIQN